MRKLLFIGLAGLLGLGLYGCDKSQSTVGPTDDSATSAARVLADSAGFFCHKNLTKIDAATLPAAVTTHLRLNYAGVTIDYAAKDDSDNILVAITQNGERKTLLFNADGSFNKELALRGGKGDRGGPGKGRGHRDSLTKVDVASLPAAITTHLRLNYAGATIQMAALDPNRGYLVMIVLNGERKTLVFNTDGSFKEELVRRSRGNFTKIDVATLPAAVTSYVSTNYAGSTISQAGKNTAGQFVVVVKPASGREVALLFAADGKFIQVLSQKRGPGNS